LNDAIVARQVLDALIRLAVQTLGVVKQRRELQPARRSQIHSQRPTPGIERMIVVGAHQRLAQIELGAARARARPPDRSAARSGAGARATRIKDPVRRDRIMMVAAFAQGLLTLLGSQRGLRIRPLPRGNTVKKRTHSLFRQGGYWYQALPNLREERIAHGNPR